MRTIVDLPENDIKRLDLIGKTKNVSRAELVRRAVSAYLDDAPSDDNRAIKNDIRGLVKAGDKRYFDGLDGVDYQRKMRGEWDERDRENWTLQDQPQKSYDD